MTPLQLVLAGFGLGVLAMLIWSAGCYVRGQCDGESRVNAEWVATANDPNRYVLHEGKHYFAHEFAEHKPELEIEEEHPEYGEWTR